MDRREPRHAADGLAERTSSFAAVYDVHVEEVYRFVHRRCQDHSLAEDITQETFLKAIRSTDDPESISIGWLLTVARNRLIDLLRRRSRQEARLRLLGALSEDPGPVDATDRLRVEKALSELRVDHRLVITLHYLDDLTVPAIAEQLGRSVKSVEGLITRARRELRAKLDEGDDATQRGDGHG